jgi:hypothetical protein
MVLISRTYANNFTKEKTILKTFLHHQESDKGRVYTMYLKTQALGFSEMPYIS